MAVTSSQDAVFLLSCSVNWLSPLFAKLFQQTQWPQFRAQIQFPSKPSSFHSGSMLMSTVGGGGNTLLVDVGATPTQLTITQEQPLFDRQRRWRWMDL
uniref:Peptidase A1 domain-containing protein n=1 Tax=Panagrellus redivivus TaxID=6233 RepID=A0A7E4ZV90_PANRE